MAKQRKLHREDCDKRDKTHSAETDALKKDMQKRLAELQADMEKRTAELKADAQKRQAELQKQIDAKDRDLQTERKQNSDKQLEIRREAEKVQKEKNTEFTNKLSQLQADYSALVKSSKIAMQE